MMPSTRDVIDIWPSPSFKAQRTVSVYKEPNPFLQPLPAPELRFSRMKWLNLKWLNLKTHLQSAQSGGGRGLPHSCSARRSPMVPCCPAWGSEQAAPARSSGTKGGNGDPEAQGCPIPINHTRQQSIPRRQVGKGQAVQGHWWWQWWPCGIWDRFKLLSRPHSGPLGDAGAHPVIV